MSNYTGISLFTGGGLLDIGLRGIVDFVGGVEYDEAIAAHATKALGHGVLCASVVDVDYRQWAGVDYLHASPPCTNASVANSNGGEKDNDTLLASAVCRAIEEIAPMFFTLENVAGYASFTAFQDILECLDKLGYRVHWRVYDAADFGVPQHRKRIMLRARRDGKPLPEVIPTHGNPVDVEASRVQGKLFEEPLLPWVGWYAAVEDLLPGCPDSQLAPWQVKRLSAQYGERFMENLLVNGIPRSHRGDIDARELQIPAATLTASSDKHPMKAVLVEGQSKGNRPPSLTEWESPSPTQAGTGGGNLNRAILGAYRVVALTPRCLARFQSVPDDYPLPEKKSLATKIIGNGIPCGLAPAVFGEMLGGGR